ncbi:unnamed protein product [Miscanthus lutarioriparius]|uniref:Uncharacterized protein n=1 Tax=Miscanthus lutarioriparius TaxID=422564 RepID=A0A811NBF5_9POAL|nr:unnamed protein product [Miscanthus lutarioriparius]
MCPIKKEMSAESGSPCSSLSASTSLEQEHHQTVWTSPPKRPAGRTKFRETRHPVFRGVRRRGNAGRWVCEALARHLRHRGRRGPRARRRHARHRRRRGGACCLNFADSAWLLAVPAASSYASLADVRRAVAEAVESFQRREAAAAEEEDARSAASSTSSSPASDDGGGEESSSAAEDSPPFELDVFNDMNWDLYYASLAQAMLVEPPPTVTTAFCDDGVAEAPLWSY